MKSLLFWFLETWPVHFVLATGWLMIYTGRYDTAVIFFLWSRLESMNLKMDRMGGV